MRDNSEPIVSLAGADSALLAAILELNCQNVVALSELDAAKLRILIDNSFWAAGTGSGSAFLLAVDQDSAYDSPNFRWFRRRFSRFVYVDRIAVAEHARGQGLAASLYRGLFEQALRRGQFLVTCEVNVDPPNPESDRFHDAFGFAQVGLGHVNAQKTVRYLIKRLRD